MESTKSRKVLEVLEDYGDGHIETAEGYFLMDYDPFSENCFLFDEDNNKVYIAIDYESDADTEEIYSLEVEEVPEGEYDYCLLEVDDEIDAQHIMAGYKVYTKEVAADGTVYLVNDEGIQKYVYLDELRSEDIGQLLYLKVTKVIKV